ncbi:formate dehydrogenase subunit delta [Pseudonocardia sp. TRM90224]|uniref:formate dehydrogenase subunit delta n=1 Tax=Pseudonocardia sp. TRM90224 TaxID=2812678 RepID=UPI001E48E713|nr:formate dehydrogenase subunit delta [Pseudonocardia sp. TRM90224]
MSSTTLPSFVRLANDIAVQFAHRPVEEAASEIAGHVRAFWDPRMRRDLYAFVERGDEGLEPAAVRAVEILRGA